MEISNGKGPVLCEREADTDFNIYKVSGSRYTAVLDGGNVSHDFLRDTDFLILNRCSPDRMEGIRNILDLNPDIQIIGTKVTLNANVLESRGHGFYSLYSADEVSDMVTEMLDSEILMSKEIKGTYGYFYILKIPQKTRQELEELNTLMGDEQSIGTETKQEEVRKNLRGGIAISDSKAERFLNYEILRKEKSPSTYMDLINLASNPIVLVLHELEVRKYFADAPEMIIKFVKLRYKNANTHEKKVVKQFFLC